MVYIQSETNQGLQDDIFNGIGVALLLCFVRIRVGRVVRVRFGASLVLAVSFVCGPGRADFVRILFHRTRLRTFGRGITCSVRMRVLCVGDCRTKFSILTSL